MLNLSPASTALSLLTNQVPKTNISQAHLIAKGPSSSNALPAAEASPSKPSIAPELIAFAQAANAEAEGLRDGSISPFETKVLKPAWSPHAAKDARLLEDGVFFGSKAPSEGGEIIVSDANFPDRRAATANAYRAGTYLAEQSQNLVKYDNMVNAKLDQAAEIKAQIEAGMGDKEQLTAQLDGIQTSISNLSEMRDHAQLHTDRATASLSRKFSFTEQTVAQGENGNSQFTGFTISHGTQGKIMEISAEGGITMFDKSGNSYTREEFAAAKPDGVIPGIHNDLIMEADAARPLEDRLSRTLGRQVTIERTISVDISDLQNIDIRL